MKTKQQIEAMIQSLRDDLSKLALKVEELSFWIHSDDASKNQIELATLKYNATQNEIRTIKEQINALIWVIEK